MLLHIFLAVFLKVIATLNASLKSCYSNEISDRKHAVLSRFKWGQKRPKSYQAIGLIYIYIYMEIMQFIHQSGEGRLSERVIFFKFQIIVTQRKLIQVGFNCRP